MHDLHALPASGRAEPSSADSDRNLLERFQAGDEEALEALLEIHWGRLLRYASRLLDDPDSAEDVLQEAFIRLWRARAQFANGRSVAAFLYLVTRHLCLNEQRRRRVRSRFGITESNTHTAESNSALDTLQANELQAAAHRAIGLLPRRRREVFELARYHDLSYREIAEVMGISVQTVANQMSAALSHLRLQLSSHFDSGQPESTG